MAFDVKSFISGGISNILDASKGLISEFVTDPTKKLEATAALEQLKINADLKAREMANQLEENTQQQLTDRASNDMKSDSWLSKNIRPLTLVALTILFIINAFLSIWKFDMTSDNLELLKQLLLSVFAFYFVGRTVEKGIAIKNA